MAVSDDTIYDSDPPSMVLVKQASQVQTLRREFLCHEDPPRGDVCDLFLEALAHMDLAAAKLRRAGRKASETEDLDPF